MPFPIVVVPYDPKWPGEYEALAAVLWTAVKDVALSIEHVGSTSVPGLAAKPILDVDIVLRDAGDLPAVAERLEALGYVHNGDQGCPGRTAFKYPDSSVPRDGSGRVWMTHHLYVCQKDNVYYVRHVGFRDYLRAHPETVAEYGRIKLELAEQFRNDRDGYTEAKTDFVMGVYEAAGLVD
jgi:GrpB-like predicted nucleotidyltransferase (UPF0157 family)